MTLREYLFQSDMKSPAFAALVGVAPTTVRKWARHDEMPSRDAMARIYTATDGQGTANDFHGHVPLGPARVVGAEG